MHRHRSKIAVLVLALAASSSSRATAGYYYSYATVQGFVAVENGSGESFSITTEPPNYTGTSAGISSFNNSASGGILNAAPPPLFPGIDNTSQSTGSADPNTPGSSVTSSASITTRVFFTVPTAEVVDFSVIASTSTSVQTSGPYERAEAYANVNVYFNDYSDTSTPVFSISSTTGAFYDGSSSTTTSSTPPGGSGQIPVFAHAGINELDFVTYAYGEADTIASTLPSVPEPSSIVLTLFGASTVALATRWRARRRRS